MNPPTWIPLLIIGIAAASTVWRLAEFRARGLNAFIVQGGNDLRALLEKLFGIFLSTIAAFVVALAYRRSIGSELGAISALEQPVLGWCGTTLGIGGAVLVATAQFEMGASWRIGVPGKATNPLVTRGLYRLSRNPIYLGMLIALAGIFLVAPNAVTLALLVGSWIIMSAQIRVEEEFLGRVHGLAFDAYRAATRRWL